MSNSVVIIAALACAASDVWRGPQSVSSREFYPTRVGDTWTYESSVSGRFTNEVVDSFVVDGQTHFRVSTVDAAGRRQVFSVRHDDGAVYHAAYRQAERTLVDFNVEPGKPFRTGSGRAELTITFIARHDLLELGGIPYQDVREFHYQPTAGPAYKSYFARGIGLVVMTWPGSDMHVRLISAEISGKLFGPKETLR